MRIFPEYRSPGEDALGLALGVSWFLLALYYFQERVKGIGPAAVVLVLIGFMSLGSALYYAYRLLKHRGKRPPPEDSGEGSLHE